VSRWERTDFLLANAGIADQSLVAAGDPDRWRAFIEPLLDEIEPLELDDVVRALVFAYQQPARVSSARSSCGLNSSYRDASDDGAEVRGGVGGPLECHHGRP
jgi:hypothetical protein